MSTTVALNRSHVVTIFGPARSGKDTLASAITEALPRTISSERLSSIDVVKRLFADVRLELGLPMPDELTQEERQGLADVKAALDRTFDWTVAYALRAAVTSPHVILYQVREVRNVARLKLSCENEGIGFTAVYVWRPDGDQVFGATTDVYRPEDLFVADVVVTNRSLSEVPSWARLIVDGILR